MLDQTQKTNKKKILICDDSELNRSILADILGNDFEITEAANGYEAINCMRSELQDYAVVLLDIVMPRMDGFAVLDMMNKFKWINEVPVIIISADSTPEALAKAYELGATDYIQRPFDVSRVCRRVMNTIMLFEKQKGLSVMVEEQQFEREKEQTLLIGVISHIVEFRNSENAQHILHVRTLTEMILRNLLRRSDKYKLSQHDITLITTASLLHDIGTIAIDEAILAKQEALTQEEETVLKTHPALGAELIEKLPFFDSEPLLHLAYEICRWHHERYDGSGYPDRLRGDAIPVSAQVVGLADAYETLTSKSGKKHPMTHEEAVKHIMAGDCGAFDPVILSVFSAISDTIPTRLSRDALRGLQIDGFAGNKGGNMSYEDTHPRHTYEFLDREREKYRFVSEESDGVVFEYNREAEVAWLAGKGVAQMGLEPCISQPLSNEKLFETVPQAELEAISELVYKATKNNPVVSHSFIVEKGDKKYNCKLKMRVQFALNENEAQYDYIGVVGKAEYTPCD